jgi:hypothetical protein
MADEGIETRIARRLRAIAEMLWEPGAPDDTDGERKKARLDLKRFADMLEGRHRDFRLRAGKPGRGARRNSAENVELDAEIVRLIDGFRIRYQGRRGWKKDGVEAAADRFAVSEKYADRVWSKMRHVLDLSPVNQKLMLFLERQVRLGNVVKVRGERKDHRNS